MMHRLSIALAVAGLTLWAWPSGAAPSPEVASGGDPGAPVDLGRAAVLPPEISPPMATTVVDRYREQVEVGLTHAAIATLGAAQTDERRMATVGGCRTPDCLRRLAEALGARWVFLPSLRFVGRNYTLKLVLFDPQGRIAFEREEACDICTLTEVLAKARTMALATGGELRRRHEALLPPREPPRRKAQPHPEPPRKKAVPQPRPEPRPRPAVPPPKPAPKPRPKPSLPQAAWMSGAMGLTSFVAGVTLLALHGRPTCDDSLGRLRCPYRYGTGTAGAVFTTLGAASLVASGVLFYYAYFRKRDTAATPRTSLGVAPTKKGAFVHVELRF